MLPHLAFRRLLHLHDQVGALVWGPGRALTVTGSAVLPQPKPLAEARRLRFTAVEPGERFGPPVAALIAGDYRQRWFAVSIPAASSAERGKRWLHWRCSGESTIWLDGEPVWGLDADHPCWNVPDRACVLWLDCGCYQTGMNGRWGLTSVSPEPGIPKHDDEGLRFVSAELRQRDERAWAAWFDVDALIQCARLHRQAVGIGDRDETKRERLDIAPEGRLALRLAHEVCDAFTSGGLDALCPRVRHALGRLRGALPVSACLIGYSHLDLLHMWPEHEAYRKGLHTAATTLALMERYPEVTFLQTQPPLYAEQARQSGALAKRVASRIRDGRWEAAGGMLCEADTQLPCGEALARNIQLGQKDFAVLGAKPGRVLWLIDVFGQSSCMPQIMRQSGLTALHTVKQHWSRLTKLPHDSFRWRGPDGSEVLVHAPATGNYCQQVDVADHTQLARAHQQSDIHPEILLATGYGDGGGGITAAMCERARRQADLAGVPSARWDRVESFFRRLERVRDQLPTWEGEIYLERHQGVSTGESQTKSAYRAAERALQAYEAACVVAGRAADDADGDWRRLCMAQFHDCITGTSIKAVFDAIQPELAAMAARRTDAARTALRSRRGTGMLAFNPLSVERSLVLEIPADQVAAVPATARQRAADGATLVALTLPGLGALPVAQAVAPAHPARAGSGRLTNGRVEARFDRGGRLASLIVDGRDLGLVQPARFVLHPNRPLEHDAWDIEEWDLALGDEVLGMTRLSVAEDGPLRAVLTSEGMIGASPARIRWILEADSPWLRLELTVDWSERQRLLKLHLPTGWNGSQARFGAPFGATLRSQRPSHLHELAQWEVTGSRWAAVTDEPGEDGLAVVTEDRYGFSCRNGTLGATLLRGAIDPNPDADRGQHRICLALSRHRPRTSADAVATPLAAETLFAEALLLPGGQPAAAPCAWRDLGSLVPSWVVPAAERGFILRAHECHG